MTRHSKLYALVRRFEGDPQMQYTWHKWAMRFWMSNAVIAIAVFVLAPAVWKQVSVLYLVLVSLYANWATDFGAMSAAEAAAPEPVSAFSIEVDTKSVAADPEPTTKEVLICISV
jgi:hypothetical protein